MKELKLGQLVATKGIVDEMEETYGFREFCMHSLLRHRALDWGDISEEDKMTNNQALEIDARVLSAYTIPTYFRLAYAEKIWIITEADRSVTTILFPHEY